MGCPEREFTRESLDIWKLNRLRDIILYARTHSRFYQANLGALPEITSYNDLTKYPFTYPADLQNDPAGFVCVPQDDIYRIVTLPTSGTTGPSKRVFFSAADQELTVDFFMVGMSTLARSGDRVLILLPGERPGSVGDLLMHGLTRLGCTSIMYGPPENELRVLQTVKRDQVNILVGSPQQLFSLACIDEKNRMLPPNTIRAVLSSTDVLTSAVIEKLKRVWKCDVFDHYGMTETGLGGGVECTLHDGYHMREADLFYEIVDPLTGALLPEGEFGEVVMTTLTRQAMPLIRYRTGDLSRILPVACPCGSFIQRIAPIKTRTTTGILLPNGVLYPYMLDELLLPIDGICDFHAAIQNTQQELILNLSIKNQGRTIRELTPEIVNVLRSVRIIAGAVDKYGLQIITTRMIEKPLTGSPVMYKRRIEIC